ncbi:CopG family transcriptional regulator [Roseateles sp. DC23W]|uniref:CopG family transcriptional regulator n=1 Tax=Pelomonas dachongensis TaxID=3299029 RepID=A0ABW7EX79_9BURK
MSTTTIRLEDELKERGSAAAQRAGKTARAFLRDAVTESVEQSEFDAEMDRICKARWAEFLVTGEAVDWEEAKAYRTAPVASHVRYRARFCDADQAGRECTARPEPHS